MHMTMKYFHLIYTGSLSYKHLDYGWLHCCFCLGMVHHLEVLLYRLDSAGGGGRKLSVSRYLHFNFHTDLQNQAGLYIGDLGPNSIPPPAPMQQCQKEWHCIQRWGELPEGKNGIMLMGLLGHTPPLLMAYAQRRKGEVLKRGDMIWHAPMLLDPSPLAPAMFFHRMPWSHPHPWSMLEVPGRLLPHGWSRLPFLHTVLCQILWCWVRLHFWNVSSSNTVHW